LAESVARIRTRATPVARSPRDRLFLVQDPDVRVVPQEHVELGVGDARALQEDRQPLLRGDLLLPVGPHGRDLRVADRAAPDLDPRRGGGAKRRGYLRNVAVALGNSANPSSVPALSAALLNDPEILVRGHAAWALGKIGDTAACQVLTEAAAQEKGGWVLEEIQEALKKIVTSD